MPEHRWWRTSVPRLLSCRPGAGLWAVRGYRRPLLPRSCRPWGRCSPRYLRIYIHGVYGIRASRCRSAWHAYIRLHRRCVYLQIRLGYGLPRPRCLFRWCIYRTAWLRVIRERRPNAWCSASFLRWGYIRWGRGSWCSRASVRRPSPCLDSGLRGADPVSGCLFPPSSSYKFLPPVQSSVR